MNNRNLLIGAGVLVVGYLLYTKSKRNSLPSPKQMECNERYSGLGQPDVMMPQEYWDRKKENWMKENCK